MIPPADPISLGTWIVLATQGVTFVSAFFSLVLALINRKVTKALSISVDGRLSELLAANKVADTATGKAEGVAEAKAEHAAETKS